MTNKTLKVNSVILNGQVRFKRHFWVKNVQYLWFQKKKEIGLEYAIS